MNKDFFVGIGAQKAGTSWLGKYFEKHPQVGFSPIKELHYFDAVYRKDLCHGFNKLMQNRLTHRISQLKFPPTREQLEKIRCLTLRLEMVFDECKYKEYFRLLAESEHKIVGEITPAYSLLDENGFSAIKRLYENAKIIFIMRDPVDRYWSHLRFEETHLGSDNFSAADNIDKCLSVPDFILRTDYRRTLTELYKAIPRENVCVVFFENLMNLVTHEREMKKITDFLNIDYLQADLETKVHVSKSVPLDEKYVYKIAAKFSDVYEYVSYNFPENIPERWQDRFSLKTGLRA